MGRGRLLRTKVKEAKQIARAQAFGAEKGKIAAWKSKPWDMKLYEFFKDKIETVSPVKFAAIIALTPLVRMAIDTTPRALELYQLLITIGSPLAGLLFTTVIDPKDLSEKLEKNDVYLWIVSFGLAYLVVENFGEIVAAGQSIGGWVSSLFAV